MQTPHRKAGVDDVLPGEVLAEHAGGKRPAAASIPAEVTATCPPLVRPADETVSAGESSAVRRASPLPLASASSVLVAADEKPTPPSPEMDGFGW